MHKELKYLIALSKTPLVGAVTAKSLIGYCGGIKNVFDASHKELMNVPGIGNKITQNIKNSNVDALALPELKFIKKNKVRCYTYLDEGYPNRLKQYDDSPLTLYYKGAADLNHHRIVSIIGTRKPTNYGKIQCEKLVQGLKHLDVLILSGLAHGIDSCAHSASVQNQIPTVGVLGHGLDRVYPAANRKLAERMIENGGLLTEFTSGTNPDRENFPMRNRIIAGMSDAVVIVESGKSGGSVITAAYANAYYKDVFAFPGKVTDDYSLGCNKLIKEHKASLIESAQDIKYVMRWDEKEKSVIQTDLFLELNDEEKIVYQLLKDHKEMQLDQMHYASKLPLNKLSSLLLQMEFKGILKTLPGKRYVLFA